MRQLEGVTANVKERCSLDNDLHDKVLKVGETEVYQGSELRVRPRWIHFKIEL
jgi:hypothetical protein